MSKKSASPTVSQDLAYILARTESDPLLFVQAAFPWGKDELKNHSILDWQKDMLKQNMGRACKMAQAFYCRKYV